MIAALLLLAAAASAAPVARERPYWTKQYPLTPYQETWTGALAVKTLDAALPKVVAAVERNDGRLTQPLANFARSKTEQQLSLTVPLKKSKRLLKALRKLGKMDEPAVRGYGAPVPLDEVRAKIDALAKERKERATEYERTPAAAEAVDELIERLSSVESVARANAGVVLWNVTVRAEK